MRQLLCLLLLAFSSSVIANNQIGKTKDCFRGSTATYEKFLTFLTQKRSKIPKDKLSQLYREADYDNFKQHVECKDFIYQVDGYNVAGFYLKPKKLTSEKLPVVIFNRGGNGNFGTVKFATKLNLLSKVAELGYVVIGSQYRGSSPFLPNNGHDQFGGDDVNDVVALLALANKVPNADPSRFALFGWSRGVMQSYRAAESLPGTKAIISAAGNSDTTKSLAWRPDMEKVYQRRIPNFKNNREQELIKRSVIHWPEKLPNAPILLLHGDADRRVHVDQSIHLAKKLDDIGHKNKLVIYKDGSHSLRKYQKEYLAEIHQWLAEYL